MILTFNLFIYIYIY